jgi:hypothetical protein
MSFLLAMTGNGKHTTYWNGDLWMVYDRHRPASDLNNLAICDWIRKTSWIN